MFKEKQVNETELEKVIERIRGLFKSELEDPNLTIKFLDKDYINKYIKIGVAISDIGIADVLINGSPIDFMKHKIELYNLLAASMPSLKIDYTIDIVLMDDNIESLGE
jgi:hypothetical protein